MDLAHTCYRGIIVEVFLFLECRATEKNLTFAVLIVQHFLRKKEADPTWYSREAR